MGKLQNKVVIITGGAGGIGSGMAKAMVKEGAIVTIVDLNTEAGEAMAKELQEMSPKSMFLQANLMERDQLPKIIDTVVEKYGKLDVLVNNAHACKIPLGRFGDIEQDIGRVAVFLASDDSQYITGQTIMVDGGSLMLH